jgi:PAS domain S-box-containing protein
MPEAVSVAPIWFTDVIGSSLMILFSFLAVWSALKLRRLREFDVISTYLLWFCAGLAGFAVSRGVGHIVRRLLLMFNHGSYWDVLQPYSGAVNSLMFVVVASITLFFHRVHSINSLVLKDKLALEQASREVMRLNQDLEELVKIRTAALAESEKKHRRIFEGSIDLIFVLNANQCILDTNKAALKALRYAAVQELEGMPLAELFASPAEYKETAMILRRDGFVKDRECRLVAADGAELLVLFSVAAHKAEEGEVIAYDGIAKDITDRAQMEKRLQQADKLASLGQISTGIAHEINNPLGVMLGYTQLLLRDHQTGSQIHQDLKIIEKHARNCKRIVEDLLKFARTAKTDKKEVNLNQALAEVIGLLGHQFGLDDIDVHVEQDSNLPPIMGDGEKLKQVFMNLLMNAKQSMPKGGAVSARTAYGHGWARIEFKDTGCGIPSHLIHRIFDPFFTTKPVGVGTGLGLSVSYGIVHDHNGRIDVESVPGKGSVFTVSLPILQKPESPVSGDEDEGRPISHARS